MGADPSECDLLQQAPVHFEITLWVCLFVINQVMFCCGMNPAFGCTVSGAYWVGLPSGQVQLLLVIGPELPGRSYETIYDWLLPVLDQLACGDARAEN